MELVHVRIWRWKQRDAMKERARRIVLAHWRGLIDDADTWFRVWFDRHMHKYMACTTDYTGKAKPQDMKRIRNRFWADVIKGLEREYDVTG